MDSPSAIVVYLLGICAPWAGSPIFCINKAQDASSKLVRVRLKGFLLQYCCNILIVEMRKLWRRDGVILSYVWIKHCLTAIDVVGSSLNFLQFNPVWLE